MKQSQLDSQRSSPRQKPLRAYLVYNHTNGGFGGLNSLLGPAGRFDPYSENINIQSLFNIDPRHNTFLPA